MEITHDETLGNFETVVDGYRAFLSYKTDRGGLDVRHTYVPEELRGQGVASALVQAAYDYALSKGLKPVASCSYAVTWLKRHPAYQGKTGSDYCGPGSCAL